MNGSNSSTNNPIIMSHHHVT